MKEQPVSGLPFRSLIVAQFCACALAGLAWFGGTKLLKFDAEITNAGLLESGVIFIVSVTLLTLFSPRKKTTYCDPSNFMVCDLVCSILCCTWGIFLAILRGSI